ncbi:MAG: BACON domain-containing protein [Candidatus Cryptobacteroides sp.]
MRTLRLILLPFALLSVLSFHGCSSDGTGEEPESVEISGLQENMQFSYDGTDSVYFTVTSNRTWSISKTSGLSWLKFTPTSGGSGRTFNVLVTASLNDDLERGGQVVLHAGSVNRTINVTQGPFPIVPEVKVLDIENNTVPFIFNVLDPVQFRVASNVKWTAEKTDLDWAEVTPLEGERKTETVITVTPGMNEGPAREGYITFRGEGAPEVRVTVTQTEFVDDPYFEVDGADADGYVKIARKGSVPAELTVVSNRVWMAEVSDSWISVTPDSGVKNLDGVKVSISAAENKSDDAREGTVTFKCADDAIDDVVIKVSQKGYVWQWEWPLVDAVLKATEWATKGRALCSDGSAIMEWHVMNDDSCYKDPTSRGPIVSSDGAGNYAYKGIWTNDNLEFTIPVEDLPANSKVNIKFAFKTTSKYTPAFWNVEYYEDEIWKPTSTSSLSTSKHTVDATLVVSATGTVFNISETAVFANAVESGNIRLRIRCVDGRYAINASDQATAYGSATMRICQWSDGSCNAILIKVEK